MKYIKIVTLSLGLVILSTLAFVGIANAQSFKTGNLITVAGDETVDSMLFAAGNNIDVAGIVNGDVYCAGQNINISGTVKGDVFCAGQTINVSGTIEGSVRLAGQNITISGIIGNSATVAAQDLIINKNGIINRDLLGGSQDITINGQIKRDIVAGSENLTIGGKIGRDINGDISAITIESTGKVEGIVNYTGLSDPNIQNGGKIVGTITRTAPKKDVNNNYFSPMAFNIFGFVYMLITTIIIALVLVVLFPRQLKDASDKAIRMPVKTALVGFVAMIFAPIFIILLLLSFVGIPLAIISILIWIIIMIISSPFAGYLLGRVILRKSKRPAMIILLGSSILVATYFIPFIGFVTMFIANLFGMGMIVMQGKKLFSKNPVQKL